METRLLYISNSQFEITKSINVNSIKVLESLT
jgi:hypothetical protein